MNLTQLGIAQGGGFGVLWGTLLGILFLNPLVGLVSGGAIGAGAGALSGYLSDYGIDDDFMRSLGQNLGYDSSALFVLIRQATKDKVMDELSGLGGTVMRTSLSKEQERKLREALAQQQAQAASSTSE